MLTKVYKYELRPGENTLELPIDAELLCVGFQGNEYFLWAAFSPYVEHIKEDRTVFVMNTGTEYDPGGDTVYIGSAISDGLVKHAFEVV